MRSDVSMAGDDQALSSIAPAFGLQTYSETGALLRLSRA